MTTSEHLSIGVFIPQAVQFLDLSVVDLFAMLDPKYLEACQLPGALVKLGTLSTIHYISLAANGTHVELTAGAFIKTTRTIDDSDVQPGNLDIILVPGPDPSAIIDEKALEFLRRHASWKGHNKQPVDILSICTGVNVLGQSGILQGRKASGPRSIVPALRKKFPGATWVDDKRWVQDENIWSSGGITNGQEMVAEYIRTKFPGPATEAVLAMADVGDKGIGYTRSKPAEHIWWLWQILRALTFGNAKTKIV